MRGVLLSLVCAAGILAMVPAASSASVAPVHPSISAVTAPIFALQATDKKVDINITTSSGGGRWYRNPVWIAIGAIAVVVLLLLVVLAARGGGGAGTTIVK